jgi:hypothetical protein
MYRKIWYDEKFKKICNFFRTRQGNKLEAAGPDSAHPRGQEYPPYESDSRLLLLRSDRSSTMVGRDSLYGQAMAAHVCRVHAYPGRVASLNNNNA